MIKVEILKKCFKLAALIAIASYSPFLFAQANLNTSSSFTTADPARANTFMDSGGVWDGANDVANGTGDTFTFSISNSAVGDAVNQELDTAYDLILSLDVPPGFRLADADGNAPFVFNVAATAQGGAANCVAPVGLTATQNAIGDDINFNLVNINLPSRSGSGVDCQFNFSIGLTTSTQAPFVSNGLYDFEFSAQYADLDNGPIVSTELAPQTVEVRQGSVAVLKTANGTSAGFGDNVSFVLSINANGTGAAFDVELTDNLNANLTNLLITPQLALPPGSVLAGNQFSISYLEPDEQIDFDVTATVINDASLLVCPPVLRNEASVIHRANQTPATFFADYQFELDNPLLAYTPVDINVDVNSTNNFSIPVQNVGVGIANNVSLSPLGLDAGFVVTSAANEDWQWDAVNNRFNYVGNPAIVGDESLAPNQNTSIDFAVEVNTCPGPNGGQIEWTPNYENVCGIVFAPPIEFSNSLVTNIPNLNVRKVSSDAALNIGAAGSYTIDFTSTNLATLPTDNIDNNNEFTVVDVLPAGLINLSIANIPVSTDVLVNGAGPFTLAGLSAPGSIPPGATITWRGDREDLLPVFPVLNIDYIVNEPGCPIALDNIQITNNATLDYASCGINNTASADFVANQSPAGIVGLNFTINGEEFETGQADTNGVPSDNNEGDHIEFEIEYEFPFGAIVPGTNFPGNWTGSNFTFDLGDNALAPPALTLVNNLNGFTAPITITVENITSGAVLYPETGFLGIAGNPAGAQIIDLSFLNAALGNDDINDLRLTIRYAATASDESLGGANLVNFNEATNLTIANGPLDCTGAGTTFAQGINLTIARSELAVDAVLNNGEAIEVCEIVPLNINLEDANDFTYSDNIDIQFNDSTYRYIPPFAIGGEFDGLGIDPAIGVSPGLLTWAITPNTADALEANVPDVDGDELSLNVQLQTVPVGPAQNLVIDLNYDTNQTSARLAADVDEDYTSQVILSPDILSGNLQTTFLPPEIVMQDQLTYDWIAQVINTGTGTSFGASFTTTLPNEFTAIVVPTANCNGNAVTPVLSNGGQTLTWDMGDLAPGVGCDLQVRGQITQQSCFQPQTDVANQISSEASWGCNAATPIVTVSPPLPIELGPDNLSISHDINTSFCELCGEAEIHVLLDNIGSLEVSNITLTEDLLATGLTYTNGSSLLVVDGVNVGAIPDPVQVGTQLTWDFSVFATPGNGFQSNGLSSAFSTLANPNPRRVEIVYNASSPGQAILTNNRALTATASFDLFCSSISGTGAIEVSSTDEIPLIQPIPQLEKFGRNVSANQSALNYGDNFGGGLAAGDVAGGTGDLVVWRLDISNLGADDLENLEIQDAITAAGVARNFDLEYICPNDADAQASLIAAAPVGGCEATDTTSVETQDIDDPFGNPNNDEPITFYDVAANGNAFVYIAGRILNFCTNNTNEANIAWGCEIDGAAGAINAATAGVDPLADDGDDAFLSTTIDPTGLIQQQTITGINGAVLGRNGIVTIELSNFTGGTIRNLVINDTLPDGYVIDTTFNNYTIGATVPANGIVDPAFAVYDGMIDTVTIGGTLALPTFAFSSVNNGITIPAQQNVLRQGDVLTFTFRIIRNDAFDNVAVPETRVENAGDNSDIAYSNIGVNADSNDIAVSFENTCATTFNLPLNQSFVSIDPEDLDIDINSADPDLFFLLNDPAPNLNLNIELSNNGGHSADNYDVFVTVGSGLSVEAPIPAACVIAAPPVLPAPVPPPGASIYQCSSITLGALNAGATINLPFIVGKQGAGADLTFKADVIGRATTSDGNEYLPPADGAPAPQVILPTPTNTLASDTNDYSLDTVLARILGFTLRESLQSCTEADTVIPLTTIGEDCTYEIQAGWFGFATPGFGNVDVTDVTVTQNVPAGQGFISEDSSTTTGGITVNSTVPAAPAILDEGNFAWNLADVINDGTFINNLIVRNLNDGLNNNTGENNHSDVKTLTVDAAFSVVDVDTATTILDYGPTEPGYPPVTLRQGSITVSEPNITIVKEICNETVSGGLGPNCNGGIFTNTVEGDEDDVLVYRLRVTNDAANNGIARSTAHDIVVTDTMDPVDRLTIRDVETDLIDNNGVGGTDEPGEAVVTSDGAVNAIPDSIVFTIDALTAGQTRDLFYRVDPAFNLAPGENLINTVNANFDSLVGESGVQTAGAQRLSATLGGAREYISEDATATFVVTPLVVNPGSKRYSEQSRINDINGPVTGAPAACADPCTDVDVVIGEEVEVVLEFQIPIASLRTFVLTDLLPVGLTCIEASPVTLPAANFAAAAPGLTGAGVFNATTCDANSVVWNFGNQQLLDGAGDGDGNDELYTLQASFIARVENVATNQAGVTLSNGGDTELPNDAPTGPTVVQATYTNASGVGFSRVLGQANLNITEPEISLTKRMGTLTGAVPPALPLVLQSANADAADTLWVEVVIENAAGGAPLHSGLRVYDNLNAVQNLTYVGLQAGSAVDVDFSNGLNQPVFSFDNIANFYPINPGETRSFAFAVSVSNTVEPFNVLRNSVQATWQSLPDNTIALNSANAIGADGSALGLRLGRFNFELAPTAVNDYLTTNLNQTVTVPAIVLTKSDQTDPLLVNTIGSIRDYEIEIELPEGVSENIVFNDNLNVGSGEQILLNNITNPVTYSCSDIASINNILVNCNDSASIASALQAAPADASTGTVTWNLSTVVTTNEDDDLTSNINPSFTINYQTQVADVANSVAGNDIQNTVSLSYTNGETNLPVATTSTTPPQVILEPDLIVDLTGPAVINAGQSGLFTLTVLNPNAATVPASNQTSTAWDASIAVNLAQAPDVATDVGDMCTADPLSLGVPNLSILPAAGAVRNLTLGTDYTQNFDQATCQLQFILTPNSATAATDARLDAGDQLTILFTAGVNLTSSADASFTNIAGATEWFNLDTNGAGISNGGRRYERTLTDGTPGISDHQDFAVIQAASVVLEIQKNLISPVSEINPGDVLTYQLRIVNTGAVGSADFSVSDDLGELNAIPYFVPGSLVIDTANIIDINPGLPDVSNSDANGGTNNQGQVEITGLGIDPAINDTTPSAPVVIEYNVTLQDVIPNQTLIRNQALVNNNIVDPVVSAINIARVTSAPNFIFNKTVADITGDAAVTELGDTLRYTITLENNGSEDASNTIVTDQIPAHTSYVAGSTTLNGTAVPDINSNSALSTGLLTNSVGNANGVILAQTPELATITFDVVVDSNIVDGTVISNQALVTGEGSSGIVFTAAVSDDPTTDIVNDPTQTVVNSGVLIDAQKSVLDLNGGNLEVNDSIRYTIIIQNNGNVDASNVSFTDALPANTVYQANSATVNGVVVTSPTIPFATAFPVSSSDRPAPASINDAVLSAGESATITFDVLVTGGTSIINQGFIASNEQPTEPTDADGNDENGDQATIINLGGVQQLDIKKEVQIIGGGVASAGGQLQYSITVTNPSQTTPASNIVLTDIIPSGTNYLANSALVNGSPSGLAFSSNTLSLDYASTYGDLDAQESFLVTFNVIIDADANLGDDIDNRALVFWGAPLQSTSATANVDVGAAPGTASVSGFVWLDANHDNIQDANEPPQAGWNVDVSFNNILIGTGVTNSNGQYNLIGFAPGQNYDLEFTYPNNTVDLGETISSATTSQLASSGITLEVGRNTANESLPLDPNGVVYNSLTREPVEGVGLTLFTSAGIQVDDACFTDTEMQGQITADAGYYAFNLIDGCAGTQDFSIRITEFPSDYFEQISEIIPPENNRLDVDTCVVDALPSPATPIDSCDVQAQATAPDSTIQAGNGTQYYLDLSTSEGPAEKLFANHIPVDPMLNSVLGISKTSSLKNVTRGQLVPYEIRLIETLGVTLSGLDIRDTMPIGFKYVEGSATVNDLSQEPVVNGRNLVWENITLPVGGETIVKLLLVVGSGVGQGEYVNTAQSFVSVLNDPASGIASASVKVVADPIFDCSDITGKVFDDSNADGYQNQGEKGLAGVKIVSAKGLLITTDEHGRYHITCAAVPNEERGSNFILKVDTRSLPSGYRMTTENPRVIKLTRGKATKFNFGASIHRVVRLDLSDAAFVKGDAQLKPYWKPSLDKLYEQLQKAPSVLRLSYLGDIESEQLATKRLVEIERTIKEKWQEMNCCYSLLIEKELFWRRGYSIDSQGKKK